MQEPMTQEEILAFGDHLAEVRQVLLAAGMVIVHNVGCINQHVSEETARATVEWATGTLKPIILSLEEQLQELAKLADKVEAEVGDLEAMLAQEAATVKERPGAGGYL